MTAAEGNAFAFDAPGSGWIRHGRARLNLAFRLSTRANQLVSATGAAKGPVRVAAALGSAVVDVALSRRLARSDRPELGLHYAMNAADLALWAALCTRDGYDQASTAINPGNPFIVEVGARYGAVSALVPLANALIGGEVRRWAGHDPQRSVFVWQLASAVVGLGFSSYGRNRRSVALRALEERWAPELVRADLRGRNDAMLAEGNLADEVQRLLVLVELAAHGTTANIVGDAKGELADRTRHSHAYVVDRLMAWQRAHNDGSDLGSVVRLDVDPALGSLVLSAAMADALDRALDATVAGPVASIALVRADARELVLAVDGRAVTLAAEPALSLRVDAMPAAFTWMAMLLVVAHLRDGAPPWTSAVTASSAMALAVAVHRAGSAGATAPRAPFVAASAVLTAFASVVQTVTLPNGHNPDGFSRVPAGLALRAHAFIAALSWRELTRAQRAAVVTSAIATVGAAHLVSARPRQFREMLGELCWAAMAVGMADSFVGGVNRDAQELEERVAEQAAGALDAAAALGRRDVLAGVHRAMSRAGELLADVGPSLDPQVRTEVERRLARCRAIAEV